MKTLYNVCICLLAIAHINAQGLSRDDLRMALNQNPLFSHKREVIVPQNVNINQTIDDKPQPDIVQQQLLAKQEPQTISQKTPPNNQPQKSEGKIEPGNNFKNEIQTGRPITAGKPAGRGLSVLGEKAPESPSTSFVSNMRPISVVDQKVAQPTLVPKTLATPIVKPRVINDRLAVNIKSKTTATSSTHGSNNKICKFNMPTFILPDMHISQLDFEQQYLVPALRAHLRQGRACKSRALTIFIDWLLYLRQKLFNI